MIYSLSLRIHRYYQNYYFDFLYDNEVSKSQGEKNKPSINEKNEGDKKPPELIEKEEKERIAKYEIEFKSIFLRGKTDKSDDVKNKVSGVLNKTCEDFAKKPEVMLNFVKKVKNENFNNQNIISALEFKHIESLSAINGGKELLWDLFQENGIVSFRGNNSLERIVGLGEITPKNIQYLKVNGELTIRSSLLGRECFINSAGKYVKILEGTSVTIVNENEFQSEKIKNPQYSGLEMERDKASKTSSTNYIKTIKEKYKSELKDVKEGSEIPKDIYYKILQKENLFDSPFFNSSAFDTSVINDKSDIDQSGIKISHNFITNALDIVFSNEAKNAREVNFTDNGGFSFGIFQLHETKGEFKEFYRSLMKEKPDKINNFPDLKIVLDKLVNNNEKTNISAGSNLGKQLEDFSQNTVIEQMNFKYNKAKNEINKSIQYFKNRNLSNKVIQNIFDYNNNNGLTLLLDIQNHNGSGALEACINYAINNANNSDPHDILMKIAEKSESRLSSKYVGLRKGRNQGLGFNV